MPLRRDQYKEDGLFALPGACSKLPSIDHAHVLNISDQANKEKCYLCKLPFHIQVVAQAAGIDPGEEPSPERRPPFNNYNIIHTTRPESASAGQHQESINSPQGKKIAGGVIVQHSRLENFHGGIRRTGPSQFEEESKQLIEFNDIAASDTRDGFNAAKKKYGQRTTLAIPAMDRMKRDIALRVVAYTCQYFIDDSAGPKIPTPAYVKRQPDRIDITLKRNSNLEDMPLHDFLMNHVCAAFPPTIRGVFEGKEMRFVQHIQAKSTPGSKMTVTELGGYDSMMLSTITNENTIPWKGNESHTRRPLYTAYLLVFLEELLAPSTPQKRLLFSPSQSSSIPSTPTPRRTTGSGLRGDPIDSISSTRVVQREEPALSRTVTDREHHAPAKEGSRKVERAYDGKVIKQEPPKIAPGRTGHDSPMGNVDLTRLSDESDESDELPSMDELIRRRQASLRINKDRTNRESAGRNNSTTRRQISSGEPVMAQGIEDEIIVNPEPESSKRTSARKRKVNRFLMDDSDCGHGRPATRSSPRKNRRLDA